MSKPDPFFDQDFSDVKTHSNVKAPAKVKKPLKSVKSNPFPITLYDDNLKELKELAKELADLTGRSTRNPNCSVAARAAITYALSQLQVIEERKKLVDIYYRSGSRR